MASPVPESSLDEPLLSHKTSMLGLKLGVVIALVVVFFLVVFVLVLYIIIQNRRRGGGGGGGGLRKSATSSEKTYRLPILQRIPHVSKEIKVVAGAADLELEDNGGRHGSNMGGHLHDHHQFSHLEWGHWFALRELQVATHFFSEDCIIGDGGYGIVYKGDLINGTQVAIKKLHNHLGQAEKEFRVEVDAIGHARHKNLVRLLGYCIEGTQRMLIYEYVKNGNLELWLHGETQPLGFLDWEKRMKILLGTAKALAYLHEAIEPKVVHRDIKSSNILIDDDFNAKVSDFGLAKLLGSENTHITTRVMGTFGYVAPEYANTGLLNEKSDIYSFGVLLLEAITGRDPVDYGRAAHEINLVEWLKTMIGSKRSEEVLDPRLENHRPSSKALRRALLTALRCLDPDSTERPKMSQVVQMIADDGI